MPHRRPQGRRASTAVAAAVLTVPLAAGLVVAAPGQARAVTGGPIGGAGVGDRAGYTQLASPLSDRTTALVNVATGDLELRSTDLYLRGTGLGYSVGRYYNSLATGGGAFGAATSMGNGADVRLATGAGGTVTYTAPSGYQVAFTPASGNAYTPPPTFETADLAKTAGGWTLTFHGSNERLTFNTGGQLVSDADRSGNTVTYAYNGDGTLNKVTDTMGRTTSFNYANGVVTSTTDPSGRHTLYSYDSSYDLTKVTDPIGAVWQFSYWEGNSNLDQVVDPRGNSETYTYDSSHRVTKATYAAYTSAAATTTFAYGNGTTTVTDPLNDATTYTWDGNGDVTKAVDPLGNTRAGTYDNAGNVTQSTDPSAAVRQYTYGLGGRLQSAQAPTESNGTASTPGAMTLLSYDPSRPYQPSQVTDPQGGQTRYGYDTAGNVTSTATYDKGGQPTSGQNTANLAYQGDPASGGGTTGCGARPGELCTSTDPRGQTTTYGYDSLGDVTTVTPPAPLGRTAYGYDGISRVTSVTDGNGVTTTIAYDPDDRVSSTTTAGTVTGYAYDPSGNLTTRTAAAGKTNYSYDPAGHLTNQAAPNSWGRTYTYDLAGNLASSSDSGGPAGKTLYGYDHANEPTSTTDPTGATTTVTYRNARPTTVAYPGGVTQTYSYDAAGRPTHTTATSGTTTLLDQTGSYALANGADQELLQNLKDAVAGTTTAYTYDTLNRLTEAATTGTAAGDYRYVLDADGNRTQTVTNGTYSAIDTFNAANQLVTRGGAAFGGYDADGDATSDGTGQAYTYSPTSQTTAVTPPGAAALAATYADTDQTERTTLGGTTSVDGALGDEQDTTGGQTTYYQRVGGRLVSERTADGTYYYVYDLHGDVAALTDATGRKVDSYAYDPYGNLTSPAAAAPVANPWRYDAAYQDTATGLYHLGARYYDPKLGRFTQPDPSGQEANTYLYAGADPVNVSDPSGLNGVDTGLATASLLADTFAAFVPGPAGTALAGVGALADAGKFGYDQFGGGDRGAVGSDFEALGTDAIVGVTGGAAGVAKGAEVVKHGADAAGLLNAYASYNGAFGG